MSGRTSALAVGVASGVASALAGGVASGPGSGRSCATCSADFTKAHTPHLQLTGGDDDFHKCTPGMVCSSWGAPMWYCMHMIARNYPEHPTPDQKQQYLAWLVSHQHTLPCCCCRSHFAQHLHGYGLNDAQVDARALKPFASTRSFFHFLCKLHNDVNASLARKPLTEDQFDQLFTFYGASQCATSENYGRAFVVIEPGPATRDVRDSIFAHPSITAQGCQLLGLVRDAPLGTCVRTSDTPGTIKACTGAGGGGGGGSV